jgi:predicted enzyme related to lactoylglutathione lyase
MASHPIVHIEIPAGDPQVLGQFYADVFGWKLDLDPTYNYLQFQAEGGPGGAFVKAGETMSGEYPAYEVGKPLLYIGTDDIDAALARVESRGGKVLLPKTEIPSVGWFSIFSDPTGNVMALFAGMRPQAG